MGEREGNAWGARVDAVRRLLRRLRAARGRMAPAADRRAPRETGPGERDIRALLVELQRAARPLLAEAAAVSPRRVRFEPDLPQPAVLHTHEEDGDGRRRWSMSFSPAALSRRGPAKTRALADELRRQLVRERAPVSRGRAAAPPDLLALLEGRLEWSSHLTRLDRWSEDFFSRMDRFLDTLLNLQIDERFELRTVDQLPDLIFEEPRGAVAGAGGGSPFFAGPGSALPGVGSGVAPAIPSSAGGRAPLFTGVSLPSGAGGLPVHSWLPAAPSGSLPSWPSALIEARHPPMLGRPIPAGSARATGLPPSISLPGLPGGPSPRSGSPRAAVLGRLASPPAGGSSTASPVVAGALPPIGRGRPRPAVRVPAGRAGAVGRRPQLTPAAAPGASVSLRGGLSASGPRTSRTVPRRPAGYHLPPVPPAPHGIAGSSPMPGRRTWLPLSLAHLPLPRPPLAPMPLQRGLLPFPERHRPWSGVAGAERPRPLGFLDAHDHQHHGAGIPPAATYLEGGATPIAGPHVPGGMPPQAPHRAAPTAFMLPGVAPALVTPAMLRLDDGHAVAPSAVLPHGPRPGSMPRAALRVPAAAPGLLHAATPHDGVPVAPSRRLLPRPGLGAAQRPDAPLISRAVGMPSPQMVHRPTVTPLSRSVAGGVVHDAHAVPNVIGGRAPFRPLIVSEPGTPRARSAAWLPYVPPVVKRLSAPHGAIGPMDHRLARDVRPIAATHDLVPTSGTSLVDIPARHALGSRPSPASTPDVPASGPLDAHVEHAWAPAAARPRLGRARAARPELTVPHSDATWLPGRLPATPPSDATVAPMFSLPHVSTSADRASGFPVPAMTGAVAALPAAGWSAPSPAVASSASVPATSRHAPWVTPWTATSPLGRRAPTVPGFDAGVLGGLTARGARWAPPAPMHALGPSASGMVSWSPRAVTALAAVPVPAGVDGGWPALVGAPAASPEMRYVTLPRPPLPTPAPRHESHVVIDSARTPEHVGSLDEERRASARMFRAETGRDHRPEPATGNSRPHPVGDDAREMRPQLPDLDRLAVNVYARIKRQLAVERERRGFLR